MYRSFVTCKDPKGVVECNSVRKSKFASTKIEEKSRNRRDKSYNREEMARSSYSPRSFEHLEISRGAQKLNQFIDSWSKGLTYEASQHQSESVGKELLKEALDLQDSLKMLGKLQEASHYVSKLKTKKKKQKEKLERCEFDEIWCEKTNSYRFEYHDHRVSDDIDGFARKNLLRSHSARKIDSGFAVPLKKAPNLIAKLMGVEDIPLEPLAPFGQMDMEKKKSRGLDFDVEMHRARKPQFLPKRVDSQRKTTLEEILKTPQCQGLDDVKDRVKVDLILEEREVRTINRRPERAEKASKVPRKVGEEKTQIRAKEHKEAKNSANFAAQKQLKEEIRDKKVDRVQKVVTNSSREQAERESLKAKNVSKSEAEGKSVAKEGKSVARTTTQAKIYSSRDQKQRENPARDNTTAITVPETVNTKNGGKRVAKSTTQAKIYSSNDQKQKENPARDNTAAIPVPETVECKGDKMTVIHIDDTSYKGENISKKLLLNSPTFVNLVEERFHLELSYPKISSSSEINYEVEQVVKDLEMLLESELIEEVFS